MSNKIAITIQNYVQFYSVKPFLDLKKYSIDIYVPSIDISNTGFKNMYDDIYDFLVEKKYNVYRNPKNIKYKILLEPSPMDYYFKFNYKYRIKYKYTAISAKPGITYNIYPNMVYDAILCYSTYEEEILNNYSKTFLVGRLCFKDFKKQASNKDKKTILYLPTYGEFSGIDETLEELEKLSHRYRIITKEHHGTNYLYSENEKSKNLESVISQFYDSSYPLSKLLEISDVVLTDNSGSIFESFYTKVPVCIFSKNIKKCNFNDFESLQYQLIKEDIIPFTDKEKELEKIINKALSNEYIRKQNTISDILFPIKQSDILASFTNVIDTFIDDTDEYLKNRIVLHREVIKYIESLLEVNDGLEKNYHLVNKALNAVQNENTILKTELEDYKKGKLYKISSKMYSIQSKVRRKK